MLNLSNDCRAKWIAARIKTAICFYRYAAKNPVAALLIGRREGHISKDEEEKKTLKPA